MERSVREPEEGVFEDREVCMVEVTDNKSPKRVRAS